MRRLLGLVAGAVALALAATGCGEAEEKPEALYVYVGGTMRPAMKELARLYEEETGTPVELDLAGSGENMIKLKETRRGDVYVAHDPYHGQMVRDGLSLEGWAPATLRPMIAVRKRNEVGVTGLADLAKPDLEVILTHPIYSTVGHLNKVMFERAGLADAMQAKLDAGTLTYVKAGGEAANAVIIGNADAAIVWDAVIFARREKLDAVDIAPTHRPDPVADAVTSATFGPIDMSVMKVTVDACTTSERPDEARKFAAFCASDKALALWKAMGYGPPASPLHLVPGKPPAEGDGDAADDADAGTDGGAEGETE
jgi:molybdate transport system substrate-binding protein